MDNKEKPKDPKYLYNGPTKYSNPKKTVVAKLLDYNAIGPPERKPNRVKLHIDFEDNRFPPESLVQNFRKYDKEGNYQRKYTPHQKVASTTTKGGSYSIMKEKSLSNPSRSSGRAPRSRKS